ncbi:MAG TPA: AAA family ATPase [Vicinamibacterales bacterium]|nr:AAA family ATPase [Vicinamibacterales bacterium]
MIVDDQRDVLAFLADPAAYGAGVRSVERIDTHSAVVFLAGGRAYKLKRAVRYDYLDFSTVERRRAACEAEVALNRRTAPQIYLGTAVVTRGPDGRLAIDGRGAPIDWLVVMVRFDEETLFDRLAARGALDLALMAPLAAAIAAFHAAAARVPDHGGRAGMAWVIDGNADGFAEQGRGVLERGACERVTARSRAELDARAALLEARRHAGFVRRCHGDLHLRNLCLVDGRPTLFDAVEFNDEIACVDVFYDLAFLLMDLWRRGLRAHASLVCNEYLQATQDFDALPLLPLFLACRAAVRAKTSATAARLQADPARAPALHQSAREYLAMAESLLRPAPPRLVAIGGLSGSGKSTLARAIAPDLGRPPGGLIVRSDVVRKSLCGVPPLTTLDQSAYAPEVTRRVYDTLAERAVQGLRAGQAVIADAVYGSPAERAAIEAVARTAGVPFTGLWLEAPPAVLAARIRGRSFDASDATTDVLASQMARDVGPVSWHRVEASADAAAVARAAATALGS